MPHASRRSLGTAGDRYEYKPLGGPKKVGKTREHREGRNVRHRRDVHAVVVANSVPPRDEISSAPSSDGWILQSLRESKCLSAPLRALTIVFGPKALKILAKT